MPEYHRTVDPSRLAPLVVLVAEDHADSRELYVSLLEMAGFATHGVASVAEARELLADVRVDVLLADYFLPDGTGREVLALCASAPPKAAILITGTSEDRIDARGFDVVLMKPVAAQDIFDAIRARV